VNITNYDQVLKLIFFRLLPKLNWFTLSSSAPTPLVRPIHPANTSINPSTAVLKILKISSV
jgi:hypothetical protein